MTYAQIRARRNDPDTSKKAAKNAVSGISDRQRATIIKCVKKRRKGLTAREVSEQTGIDYYSTQRRISECGLVKTDTVRDGCRVWTFVG